MLTDHQEAFLAAFCVTAQEIINRAQAEADPPDPYKVFWSKDFEEVVLNAMGLTWEEERQAIRHVDPMWSEVRRELLANKRELEKAYKAWFEAGGGYDYEHIPLAPEIDCTPQKTAWTNPRTKQRYQKALVVGQVVVGASRWSKHRVPTVRWEKSVQWFDATSGLLFDEGTLIALTREEQRQQDDRVLRYAGEIGKLCDWSVFFASTQKIQRSARKRVLELRGQLKWW